MTSGYTEAYNDVWEKGILPWLTTPSNSPEYPDIILLQECIGFVDWSTNPSGRWYTGNKILQTIVPGYRCFFFPAFSSHTDPHPARWQRFKQGSGISNFIPDYVEAQQGYGVCIRDESSLRTMWLRQRYHEDTIYETDDPSADFHLCFEAINLTTGLYLGSRDTEPRLAILGRMKVGEPGNDERYVNFLNVHLTTLRGEREGNIRLNRLATRFRLTQLDLLLDNVISAYQEATTHRVPRSTPDRKEDLWIIGGDFNATPDSEELSLIQRLGFIDGHSDKTIVDANTGSPYNYQIGTKWSLDNPEVPAIVVDYILCGLERTAFPMGGIDTKNSKNPYRPLFRNKAFETDHAVLYASFKI